MSTVRRLLPPALRSRLRTMVNSVTAPGAPAMGTCDPSGSTLDAIQRTREVVAATFLRGDGLEIGALHLPLKTPADAIVKYVDRMTTADLRKHYPELAQLPLVDTTVVDNGETLGTVADASQDFVIANHFLEHCQNPIRTLQNLFRVVRIGGVLYMAVPDKRWTFDHDRPCTTIDHLLRDYRDGPEWSKRGHFEEWTRLVNKRTDEAIVAQETQHLLNIDYSIHFHVWGAPNCSISSPRCGRSSASRWSCSCATAPRRCTSSAASRKPQPVRAVATPGGSDSHADRRVRASRCGERVRLSGSVAKRRQLKQREFDARSRSPRRSACATTASAAVKPSTVRRNVASSCAVARQEHAGHRDDAVLEQLLHQERPLQPAAHRVGLVEHELIRNGGPVQRPRTPRSA